MKSSFLILICILTSAPLFLQVHCSGQQERSLPDGFYLEDETRKSPQHISIRDNEGKLHDFRVREYTNIVATAIYVISLKPRENAYHVQINVESSDTNWTIKPIALVVKREPYFELTKSAGTSVDNKDKGFKIPAMVSLSVSNETAAQMIKERLSKKFKLEDKPPQREAVRAE